MNKSWLFNAILGTSATIGGIWATDWLLKQTLNIDDTAENLHVVESYDGEELSLWRYPPKQETPGEPVLLVHGLSATHRNLAFNERYGLAHYLNQAGYDCWAVDLRGRGPVKQPDAEWTFDHYVYQDLPAVVDYILNYTGFPKLHWIGHSMGGMSYLAYTGSGVNSGEIASGVALASPVYLSEPAWVQKVGRLVQLLSDSSRNQPDSGFEKIPPKLMNILPWRFWFMLLLENRFNLNSIRVAINSIATRISPSLMIQFMRWIVNEEWKHARGTIDYRDKLSDVEAPTMMVAGANDPLCPDAKVAGYPEIGSSRKKFVRAGTDQGFQTDYDHVGLVFSRNAPLEIFPIILDWVREHSID